MHVHKALGFVYFYAKQLIFVSDHQFSMGIQSASTTQLKTIALELVVQLMQIYLAKQLKQEWRWWGKGCLSLVQRHHEIISHYVPLFKVHIQHPLNNPLTPLQFLYFLWPPLLLHLLAPLLAAHSSYSVMAKSLPVEEVNKCHIWFYQSNTQVPSGLHGLLLDAPLVYLAMNHHSSHMQMAIPCKM